MLTDLILEAKFTTLYPLSTLTASYFESENFEEELEKFETLRIMMMMFTWHKHGALVVDPEVDRLRKGLRMAFQCYILAPAFSSRQHCQQHQWKQQTIFIYIMKISTTNHPGPNIQFQTTLSTTHCQHHHQWKHQQKAIIIQCHILALAFTSRQQCRQQAVNIICN